jgi:acid phosphatase type 7
LPGPVKSATLRLFANSSSTTGVDVRGVADTTWGEKTITYANMPAMAANVTGSSGPFTTTPAWISIDVTPLITGNGTFSLAVTTTNSTQISLSSRESGANAPQLVVGY